VLKHRVIRFSTLLQHKYYNNMKSARAHLYYNINVHARSLVYTCKQQKINDLLHFIYAIFFFAVNIISPAAFMLGNIFNIYNMMYYNILLWGKK